MQTTHINIHSFLKPIIPQRNSDWICGRLETARSVDRFVFHESFENMILGDKL